MPFGLGLGILFLSLYNGRSANRFSLLTGQIVSVQSDQLTVLIVLSAIVLVGCCSSGARCASTRSTRSRPPRAACRRRVSFAFMMLLGIVVAVAVHIIGALLVLALLVTPAAAAMRVATGPIAVPLLAAGFVSAVGGILLAVMRTLPVSPYITTISFLIYLVCRVVDGARRRGSVEA
jgi:zinc/manganese transport system permease protein